MVDYFLRHRAASYLMTVVLLAGGALSFLGMGSSPNLPSAMR